jgi:hypothetical protein
MFNAKNASILALVLATGLPAVAQAPKITGLGQLWYHQMGDSNLRYNSTLPYYPSISRYQENGFLFRRAEIKLAAAINDNIDYEVMIDPATDSSGNIFQDFLIKYKLPKKAEVRIGQFKNLQTLEGMDSSSGLMFAERSMLGRAFGDTREQGIVASMPFGDPKAFGARAHLGFFNSTGKYVSGTPRDNSAQKDIVARLEMNYGKEHSFGLYTLQAAQNIRSNAPFALAFQGIDYTDDAIKDAMDKKVKDNNDKTTNMGFYYRYQTSSIHATVEYITGLLGRRNPSLGTAAGNAGRQHLDQTMMGYCATFAYTTGKHTMAARYDFMNYNSGNDWYTATNPYKTGTVDRTPEFTEMTLGYTFAFDPAKPRAANIKVNYIMRSKNHLQPFGTQTTEQGGDSLLLAFQVSF